jgi:ABC-type multidrug transport system ATPase subunit
MKLTLHNISKQYKSEWIFKDISLELNTGDRCVILGANGSGKSTLLKIISGAMLPSEGNINYSNDLVNLNSTSEKIFGLITIAAPYMELIEDHTLAEHIDFHFHFKKKFSSVDLAKVPELIGLKDAANKQIKYFSSGMKQRVRLGLAILSDTPLLLLDEPCSNLDQKGIDWYSQLVREYSNDRLIIVCSNHQKHEYSFCSREFSMESFKQ